MASDGQIDFGDDEAVEGGPVAVDDASDVQFSYEDGSDGDGVGASRETPCELVSGCAGTGKSYTIMKRLEEDPMYAVLCASTGIAAINLNTITIHSTLGFFDTNSLRDAYLQGSAQRKLRRIHGEGYRNLVLDEVSMVSNDTLDLLMNVFNDVNQNLSSSEKPIGLVLSGDFCQLPAIADKKPGDKRKLPTPWAFDARCWDKFAANTMKLTKVWRQSDERFLTALNYARSGRGDDMVGVLDACGVQFEGGSDMEFDGTTILGTNDEVNRFNKIALDGVKGRLIGLPSRRWGRLRPEWKNIPEGKTEIRESCYVMLLANKYDGRELVYANGDCGHVVGITIPQQPGRMPSVQIELVRTGQIVDVNPIVRSVDHKDKPDTMSGEDQFDGDGWYPKPHRSKISKRYVEGQVEYYPIRVAYASTCHKAQGLSLDRVQIDARHWMMSGPAMLYVGLSRCRTIEGLRLVGSKDKWAHQCRIDERVRPWL